MKICPIQENWTNLFFPWNPFMALKLIGICLKENILTWPGLCGKINKALWQFGLISFVLLCFWFFPVPRSRFSGIEVSLKWIMELNVQKISKSHQGGENWFTEIFPTDLMQNATTKTPSKLWICKFVMKGCVLNSNCICGAAEQSNWEGLANIPECGGSVGEEREYVNV